MYDTCIETQIYNFQHFETGFDRETGINGKICQIIEILRATNDLEYLNLLTFQQSSHSLKARSVATYRMIRPRSLPLKDWKRRLTSFL